MISRKKSLREVYVWELPVRIFHWVNATAIVALCVTGYIIGNPPAIQHATPPEANYWFGWVRFIHFAAAFVFILNFIVRLYWAFPMEQLPPPHPKTVEEYFRYHQSRCIVVVAETGL